MSRARSVSRVGVETTLTISSNGNVGFGSTIPRTRVDVAGNLNVSGVITATSFVGNVTGTASTATAAATAFGLSGTPDITVGIVTATVISAGSTVGTAGSVLTSTGTGLQWTSVAVGPQVSAQLASLSNLIGYNNAGLRSDAANGRLEVFGTGNFRVFTSPGTFVVNPGISSIRVRVVGAGGNGGTGGNGGNPFPGYPTPYYYNANGGGGGGGGGYAHKVITSFTAPRTYTVTVGSAPGGTSSFGAEVSATGGSNGSNGTPSITYYGSFPAPYSSSGGAGGSGSGGDVNFTGATGPTSGSSTPGGQAGSNGGKGGAAATQKGNGSGSSVPGLPSLNTPAFVFLIPSPDYKIIDGTLDNSFINRFPFDIFTGIPGTNIPVGLPALPAQNPLGFSQYLNGVNGGEGSQTSTVYSGTFSGSGGIAAGGGYGFGGGQSGYNGSSGSPGGSGGIGGGGAGGGGGNFNVPGTTGGAGGTGGSGIVIVEW